MAGTTSSSTGAGAVPLPTPRISTADYIPGPCEVASPSPATCTEWAAYASYDPAADRFTVDLDVDVSWRNSRDWWADWRYFRRDSLTLTYRRAVESGPGYVGVTSADRVLVLEHIGPVPDDFAHDAGTLAPDRRARDVRDRVLATPGLDVLSSQRLSWGGRPAYRLVVEQKPRTADVRLFAAPADVSLSGDNDDRPVMAVGLMGRSIVWLADVPGGGVVAAVGSACAAGCDGMVDADALTTPADQLLLTMRFGS